jgi:hypothetical protein
MLAPLRDRSFLTGAAAGALAAGVLYAAGRAASTARARRMVEGPLIEAALNGKTREEGCINHVSVWHCAARGGNCAALAVTR